MATFKKIIVGLLLLFSVQAHAQLSDAQQLVLDIEKLTQLKGILADMKTGYQIYNQGYGTISGLAKRNFDLHNVYLTGLLAVSPSVRNYSRVAEIILQQASLVSEYKRVNASFKQSGSFSVSELSYMSNVYTRLINQSLDNLDELNTILSDSKLRMSDAERIKGIDRIYASST
ncbi:MAG: TerB family tellurite resistance protein, partial [Bacteroidota bacterium]|nr:TerB family tellurite resistance protein [Bacteroidota bacterium]